MVPPKNMETFLKKKNGKKAKSKIWFASIEKEDKADAAAVLISPFSRACDAPVVFNKLCPFCSTFVGGWAEWAVCTWTRKP